MDSVCDDPALWMSSEGWDVIEEGAAVATEQDPLCKKTNEPRLVSLHVMPIQSAMDDPNEEEGMP